MSNQFTPGPWHVEQDNVSFVVKDDDGITIAGTFGFGAPDREEQEEGNAGLIAAAPALYRAAELLAAWDQSDGDVALISEACSQARAALALVGSQTTTE